MANAETIGKVQELREKQEAEHREKVKKMDVWEEQDIYGIVRGMKGAPSGGIRVSRKQGIKSRRRKPTKLIKGFGKR